MPAVRRSPVPERILRSDVCPHGLATESRGLRDGTRVAFRVSASLADGRYRIRVGGRTFIVSSRMPLEAGIRYVGEVRVRPGLVEILLGGGTVNGLESLLVERQEGLTRMGTLLPGLLLEGTIPGRWFTNCDTAEGLRLALRNCGMFYEARLFHALSKGESPHVGEDLKGHLLALASGEPKAASRETVDSALRQIETHQLLSAQAAPEGPVAFWLPFAGQRVVQGFARRILSCSRGEVIVVMKVPFLVSEQVLVTLVWRPGIVDVHLAAGTIGYPLLLRAAARLEERLAGLGDWRWGVRVSRTVPARLREKLRGIRFVESYG